MTFPASTLRQALEAIERVPHEEPYFVLKDRYGYGCGAQVHRLAFDDPRLEECVAGYLEAYGHVLIQEYCAEVGEGDIVVTFFDDELIGALRRVPAEGQWKTNFSTGAEQQGYNLTPDQESIARALKRSFPECRLASVDMLPSGRILEINAFPGGEGLLRNYGISLGEIVMDRLERELLGTGAAKAAPVALSWEAERASRASRRVPDGRRSGRRMPATRASGRSMTYSPATATGWAYVSSSSSFPAAPSTYFRSPTPASSSPRPSGTGSTLTRTRWSRSICTATCATRWPRECTCAASWRRSSST